MSLKLKLCRSNQKGEKDYADDVMGSLARRAIIHSRVHSKTSEI